MIVLVPVKKDSGEENVDTRMTWEEVLDEYPAKKKDAGVEVITADAAQEVPAE